MNIGDRVCWRSARPAGYGFTESVEVAARVIGKKEGRFQIELLRRYAGGAQFKIKKWVDAESVVSRTEVVPDLDEATP